LLIEKNNGNIMLLDGAEDFELAERMLAVGIPTGLHSDVVYPVEWGPVDSNAIALAAKHDVWFLLFGERRRLPAIARAPQVSRAGLVYEAAEIMLNPSGQANGLIEPGVTGATIKVASPLAKSPRKAKVRRLKPIVGSA
jgi:hypothetical protein